MSIKDLVGKQVTEEVDFCGGKVEVRKLSVTDVFKVQQLVKENGKSKKEGSELALVRDVIRMSVIGAEDLTDAQIDSFPLSELTALSETILSYSGLTNGVEAGN